MSGIAQALIMAAGGDPPTDPNFASVVLLLHLDGTNGSTTITDSSSYGKTCSVSGSATLTTSTSKFGSACYQGAANGVITASLGTEGSLTGDFTIELWEKQAGNGVVMMGADAYLYNDSFQSNGALWTSLGVTTAGTTFGHVAITRVGSTMRAFRDGVLSATTTYSGTIDLSSVVFGKFVPNNNLYFVGNIDEIRITKGVGRYTATFVPRGSAFPNS